MIKVLFNKKGGVGKSSLSVNLAAIAASKGIKTLLIDLDTQCNSSRYVLADNQPALTVADFFEQQITFHLQRKPSTEFCSTTQLPNLDIMAGSERLSEMETELNARHKIYKLRDGLNQLANDYQLIFIDTPPAYNFYSLSALIAANHCLIPIDCDDFARQGLYSLLRHIEEVKEDHNAGLEVEGIVANQYLAQAKLPQKMLSELVEEGFVILGEPIPSSVKMKESHQLHKALIQCAPKHKLTASLLSLFDALSL